VRRVALGLLALAALVTVPLQAQPRFEPIRCVVTVSTATTVQAVGGDCAAQVGRALFITDILSVTNAGGMNPRGCASNTFIFPPLLRSPTAQLGCYTCCTATAKSKSCH